MSEFPHLEYSLAGTILLHFSFFGSCLALLFSFGQLVLPVKSARNYFLALMFLCQAVLIGYGVLVLSGTIYRYPHLFQIDIPFLFSLAPALYLLFCGVIDENFEFNRKHLFHFTPALAATLVMSWYYFEPASSKQERMMAIFQQYQLSLPEYLFGTGLAQTSVYVMVIIKRGLFILNFKSLFSEIASIVLLAVTTFGTIVCAIVLYGLLVRDHIFILTGISLISLAVCIAYFIGRRFTEFYHDLQVSAVKQKYQRSLLNDIDLEGLQEQLETLMRTEKVFQHENVSLSQVAESLDLTGHQLSQFLNEHLQKNFATFINEHRVAAAQEMLLADKEASILNIAYQVGFNSKSAFNRAFQRVCNQSPSQYRAEKSA